MKHETMMGIDPRNGGGWGAADLGMSPRKISPIALLDALVRQAKTPSPLRVKGNPPINLEAHFSLDVPKTGRFAMGTDPRTGSQGKQQLIQARRRRRSVPLQC